jgi:SAM-dependent methyltransferase
MAWLKPRFLIAAVVLVAAVLGGWFLMTRQAAEEAAKFTPQVGQPGKDVIWVPTPDALVREMLTIAAVTPQDQVVDLGSGDGKIAIAAARDFGAKSRGVEYNPDMVALSRRNAEAAGVADKVEFIEGDIFTIDFTDATVVTLYLLPNLNLKLRPRLLDLKPGTRIVSHAFDMGDWTPDGDVQADGAQAYYWVVPAKAEGTWAIPLTTGETIRVNLVQTYQKLGGTAEMAGKQANVREGALKGGAIRFVVEDWRGGAWIINGAIEGDRMKAGVQREGGDVERFFEVVRGGAAPSLTQAPTR